MTIPTEDIGTVIGPGGKQIRAIIEASGAEIDIQDTGIVTITSNDQEGAKIARKMISDLTFKPEVGMVIKGKVVRIIPIGAFVELGGGKDGMVHISQICQERIETIEPHVNIGDEVIVKVLPKDDQGRLNFSRREALIEVEGLVPENTVSDAPRKPRRDFKGDRGGRAPRKNND